MLDRHGLEYELDWELGGEPFLTPRGSLSEALSSAILAETGVTTELSTTGGVGRPLHRQDLPAGHRVRPCNATIHKVNERIEIASLDPLKNIYRRTLENLLPVQP